MNFMIFHILGIMIPTDELIFFRGVGIPPTSHQMLLKSSSSDANDKLTCMRILC